MGGEKGRNVEKKVKYVRVAGSALMCVHCAVVGGGVRNCILVRGCSKPLNKNIAMSQP